MAAAQVSKPLSYGFEPEVQFATTPTGWSVNQGSAINGHEKISIVPLTPLQAPSTTLSADDAELSYL